MISLSVSNLRKTYGIDLIFENVSFAINEREKVAIVGANGAGKTTLFNIIVGDEPKDSGDIFIAKDTNIGYMSQNVNITSDKTLIEETVSVFEDIIILENELRRLEQEISNNHQDEEKTQKLMKEYSKKTEIFAKNDGYSYNSKARGVLIGLGFNANDLDKKVELLSGGEKSMVAIAFIMAIFMYKPSPFTFLDEIEAALDEKNTKNLLGKLRDFTDKSQFILITHNKETMKESDSIFGVTMNKEIGISKIVSPDKITKILSENKENN